MTKSKRATINLVSSIVSLFACVALFFGMTFAWFTDSVTSGKNKIQAGNLDVEVQYSKNLENGSWKEVTDNTKDIFTDADGNDILWEPGAANVVYLKIKNAGTLALKYNLGINIVSEVAGTNVNDNSFKLSDFIRFGQVELQSDATAYKDRSDAINALTESKKISEGYTLDGTMKASSEKIIALVVYMPENVGNDANYKTGTEVPEINMGITLLATQAVQEKDGFNKYYDSSAAYDSVTETVTAGEATVLKIGGVAEIVVPANAKAGNDDLVDGEKLTLSVEPTTTTPQGYTITNGSGTTTYDITIVNQDGEKISDQNGAIQVKFYVGESGASDVKHIVNGVEEDVPFTTEGDYIIFTTSSFSPYVIRSKYVAMIENKKYEDLQEALDDAKNGKKVVLLSDIYYENCVKSPLIYQAQNEDISTVLDLNGKTITATLSNVLNISVIKIGDTTGTGAATLIFEDSSENMSGTVLAKPMVESDGWNVAVSSVSIERNGRMILNGGNIIIDAGNFTSANPYGVDVRTNGSAHTAELTVNGGYIESITPSGMGVRLFANSELAPIKFVMTGGEIRGAANDRGVWLHNANGSKPTYNLIEVTISGGKITADRALEVADFNKETDIAENIKVTINGGEFVSTNVKNNKTHPECSVLTTGMSEEYYNMTFSHVKVTDNR